MKIYPSKPAGEITIQPSKSYLHRMLIMSALSGQVVEIHNVNYSDDIKATINALSMMGLAECERERDSLVVIPGDGRIKGTVDCGESGSTLRFLVAVALTLGREVVFTGRGRLMERPLGVYEELCEKEGFVFDREGDMLRVCGKLRDDLYTITGNISSQFASGMLMALSTTGGILEIRGSIESMGYIDMTMEVMKRFGVNIKTFGNRFNVHMGIKAPKSVTAQGDWSHGANFFCMGARDGNITIKGLDPNSNQRDKAVAVILERMGAKISGDENQVVLEPAALQGTGVRGSDIPDIIPALSMVLGVCEGTHKISSVGRLRVKESDRIQAICGLMNSIGGKATATEDSITIVGVDSYTGGKATVCNDHRIAMAAAIASCYSSGVIEIDNSECVNKSAPAFWEEFKSLGGIIENV